MYISYVAQSKIVISYTLCYYEKKFKQWWSTILVK